MPVKYALKQHWSAPLSIPLSAFVQVPVFYHSCNFTGPYTDDALKTVAKFPFVVNRVPPAAPLHTRALTTLPSPPDQITVMTVI